MKKTKKEKAKKPQCPFVGEEKIEAYILFLEAHYSMERISDDCIVPIINAAKQSNFGTADQLTELAIKDVVSANQNMLAFVCCLAWHWLSERLDLGELGGLTIMRINPLAYWIKSAVMLADLWRQGEQDAVLDLFVQYQQEEREIMAEYLGCYDQGILKAVEAAL